jgi:hypothetical protein
MLCTMDSSAVTDTLIDSNSGVGVYKPVVPRSGFALIRTHRSASASHPGSLTESLTRVEHQAET